MSIRKFIRKIRRDFPAIEVQVTAQETVSENVLENCAEQRYNMNNVDVAVTDLICSIKASEIYREYMLQLERVKAEEGLKEQIDEYRTLNYILQSSGDIAFDKIEHFERGYEDFRANPLVSDFLAAELAFCRMMQDISFRITEEMHFE